MQMKTGSVRPVRWCYDYELASRDQNNDLLMLTTGMFPYLLHKGNVLLTDKGLVLTTRYGKIKEDIAFSQMDKVYLGYDDLYPPRLSKNFGSFWSPLRLTLTGGMKIYLIVFGYFGIMIRNKQWFEDLKALLSVDNK